MTKRVKIQATITKLVVDPCLKWSEVTVHMAPLLASLKERPFRLGDNIRGQIVQTTLYTLLTGNFSCI
jgi:hypothetical protein